MDDETGSDIISKVPRTLLSGIIKILTTTLDETSGAEPGLSISP